LFAAAVAVLASTAPGGDAAFCCSWRAGGRRARRPAAEAGPPSPVRRSGAAGAAAARASEGSRGGGGGGKAPTAAAQQRSLVTGGDASIVIAPSTPSFCATSIAIADPDTKADISLILSEKFSGIRSRGRRREGTPVFVFEESLVRKGKDRMWRMTHSFSPRSLASPAAESAPVYHAGGEIASRCDHRRREQGN